ncbi:tyrosine-protein phosphatase [Sphingomonas zeae]|uniref:Tyrosine-protein phosphatase n=2 Tax=Sphingomonadaceae TaxID=41297 RepID=A0A7Y6B1U9_9SPHN|nr:tyrosine-protein phosphatase [Sphingomonas zeae]MBB4049973.1 protein-tyrosine phosphatase [Sphingomonas zeae]MDK8187673.1 tyrosine-protein phosphatase [Sphingomonas zeae]NUU45897.1 tyrosine-protein phosphatase [Sphingomonas zeae]
MRAMIALALVLAIPTGASASAPVAAPAHSRVLPLQGGHNFRDLGGYRTADGRTVKWGLLYRSGEMHDLTRADYAYLQKLGIRTVCDFRDTRERATEPTLWPAGHSPKVLSDDYALDMSSLRLPGDPAGWTHDQVVTAMTATYPKLLDQFRGQYRRMFAELLAGDVPLAFHCTAGKDRTGVAAALLLTALGVPRATTIDDYLLSNQHMAPMPAHPTGFWAKLSPEAARTFAGVDRRYIDAVFAVTDRHPGGTMGYLKDELGLGAPEIARLRALYLTKG